MEYVASVLALNDSAFAPAVFVLVLGVLGFAFPGVIFRAGRPWRRMMYGQNVEPSRSGLAVTRAMGALFIVLGVVVLLSP